MNRNVPFIMKGIDMDKKIRIQYCLFKKKLLLIEFYQKKDLSYDEIAYILDSRVEIIQSYCLTLLKRG